MKKIATVLEPVRQFAAGVFAADVLLPFGTILRTAGHHDFKRLRFPLSPQLDQRVVEVHADAPAHADDHCLALHRLHALLEMRHQIGGHQRDAFRIAHQRFQRSPFGFEFLLLRKLLAFGDLLKLRVELRRFRSVQSELGNAALLIDRRGGLVGEGALDVVDRNVIAKERPRVRVRLLDGRAGEADERRIRQDISGRSATPAILIEHLDGHRVVESPNHLDGTFGLKTHELRGAE